MIPGSLGTMENHTVILHYDIYSIISSKEDYKIRRLRKLPLAV